MTEKLNISLSTDSVFEEAIQSGWDALKKENFSLAMTKAQLAARIDPESAKTLHLLGIMASRDGRSDIALPLLHKSLEKEQTARCLRDIAEAYLVSGNLDAAEKYILNALESHGDSSELLGLKAAIEIALEKFESGKISAQRAIALNPHQMAWEGTLAFCQLISFDFVNGFKNLTGRSQNLKSTSRCPLFNNSEPQTLWLKNEQGPGDTIFYLRYASHLKKLGWTLHLQTDKKTKVIMRETGLFSSVKEDLRIPNDDLWLNLGDLPLAAIQLDSITVPPPLALIPDSNRIAKIKQLLQKLGPAPYIGVTWRAGPKGSKQRNGLRMYDKFVQPEQLGAALSGLNGTFISIQRLPDSAEFSQFQQALGKPLHNLQHYNDNLQDMLALMSCLDEYIATPNTNVHLRMGLSLPAKVLVNRPLQDWRWLAEGNASPWYPKATIYRQALDGDWRNALSHLSKDITSMDSPSHISSISIENQTHLQNHLHTDDLETLEEFISLGWDFIGKDKIAGAIEYAQKALSLVPEHPKALHLLGWAAYKDLKPAIAIELLKKSLSQDFTKGKVIADLVRIYEAANLREKATQLLKLALDDDAVTGKANLHYASAALAIRDKRFNDAINDYQECLKIAPNAVDALGFMGMVQLKLGQARLGFRHYSGRPEARVGNTEGLICPVLRGDISNLKILVVREMGLGDELTYLRYLPWLTNAGAHVTYWAGRKLTSILKRHLPNVNIVSDEEPCPKKSTFDLVIKVNELPVAVEALNAPEIAPPMRLFPLEEKLLYWKERLQKLGPAPYFAINWRAGARINSELESNFSSLAKHISPGEFASAISGISATLLSVQRYPAKGELDLVAQITHQPVHNIYAETDDLEDLLAILYLADENIGVSNTNMHLRASLGKGSKVLVPYHDGDWRWSYQGNTSVWFDLSKVYRQNESDSWSAVTQSLHADLCSSYGEIKNIKPQQQEINVESNEISRETTATEPRVLVGIMRSGENEFDDCVAALGRQTFKNHSYFVIENLPNKEAHDRLYSTFMENSNACDYFLKLDADMVFFSDTTLEEMVSTMQQQQVAHLFAWVNDCPSGIRIPGIQMFASDTRWSGSDEQLNVDYPPKVNGNGLNLSDKDWISHMPNPSEYQLFRYGIHKALKSIQPDRTNKNIKKGILHLLILQGIARRAETEPNFWLPLMGATLVYTKHFSEINYNSDTTKSVFEKIKSNNEYHKKLQQMTVNFWSNQVQVSYWWLDNFNQFIF